MQNRFTILLCCPYLLQEVKLEEQSNYEEIQRELRYAVSISLGQITRRWSRFTVLCLYLECHVSQTVKTTIKTTAPFATLILSFFSVSASLSQSNFPRVKGNQWQTKRCVLRVLLLHSLTRKTIHLPTKYSLLAEASFPLYSLN